MNAVSVFAVGFGAFAGAIVRWLLGLALNPLLPHIPLGTLAANLVGGLIMGVAMGLFAHFDSVPLAWRLGHDRLPRRVDDVLLVLGRDHEPHAACAVGLDRGDHRRARGRLDRDDPGRLRTRAAVPARLTPAAGRTGFRHGVS